jgi:hypothetical protein
VGHYSISGLAAGTYDVSVSAPGNLFPQTHRVILGAGVQHTESFQLAPPVLPPSGTAVTAPRTLLGTPVVKVDTPFHVTKTRCEGGVGGYQLLRDDIVRASGAMTAAGSLLLAADVTATGFTGAASLRLIVDCPNPTDDEDVAFGLYVEQLAYVRDLAGTPLPGATIIFHRAEAEAGPFAPVADGSVIMQPLNRANPSAAASDGSFAWDPMTGFYFVRAELAGCTSPDDPETAHVDSAVFAVPPSPPEIDLRLVCGETDTDGDGYSDADEVALGFDPNTYCNLMRADIDGDGSISIVDLSAIAGVFGRTIPPIPSRLDQDGDAKIAILDLAAVAGLFGRTIAGCP